MQRLVSWKKSIVSLARMRYSRGFSLASLGPNESRILFDGACGAAAVLAALAFWVLFRPHGVARPGGDWALLLAPGLFLAANTALGLYGSLRTARTKIKVAALSGSMLATGLALAAVLPTQELAVLWATLLYGPVVIARVLLGLPYSRHKDFRRLVRNIRGPVLVVGGAGYIGSHAVEQLVLEGYSVRVLDRLMYGREPIRDFIGRPRFELVEGDATDITKLTLAMQNVSAVVHLAGLVGDPACGLDANFTRHANIVATRMVKEVAQSVGASRFVFASSCSVYGVSQQEAVEAGPLNPVSLYALTKIDSERELLSLAADDFFVTILRFATVLGHSRRPRFDLVANLFTAQALTDGVITVTGPGQWRPFVHVRDLARAIVLALKAPPNTIQGQIFNVGDRRLNMTILELAQTVKAVIGDPSIVISVRDQADDRRSYAVSFEKIRSVLGFDAAVTVADGIREMAEHFRQGHYRDYRDEIYSNLAVTRKAAARFHDPSELARLYSPLSMQAGAEAGRQQ